MRSIGDYLDQMVVTMTSPDRNISARVFDYTELQITFRPGSYERYDESELSYQLARLAALTWVAYRRGRSEAFLRSQGLSSSELSEAQPTSDDPKRRRYEEELAALEGEGRSVSGVLRVRTRGMSQWTVDIEPGALRQFSEGGFLNEIHSAFRSLLQDRETKIIALKAEHFDLGLPTRWRSLLKELQAANRARR